MLNDKIQRVLPAEQEVGEAGGGSEAEKRATATKTNSAASRERNLLLSAGTPWVSEQPLAKLG